MNNLLPCPFCGSRKVQFYGKQRPYWTVVCECGADVGLCHTKDQAEQCWNRRPTPEPQGEAVFYAHADTIEVMKHSPPGKGKCRQTFITNDPEMWDGNATPLYARPQPGEGGGEVLQAGAGVDPVTAERYAVLRDWFLRGGRYSEVMPAGHVKVYSEAEFDAEVDRIRALAKGGQGGGE